MKKTTGRPGRTGNQPARRLANDGDRPVRDLPATENLLLGKLSPVELAAILNQAERLSVATREVLIESGAPIEHVYFPVTAMISLLTVLSDGLSIEAMTVGREGMAGLPLFHGVRKARERAVCQIEGELYRLPAKTFTGMLDKMPTLSATLHLYSQFAQDSMAQSAACNGIHLIEQRCARWLLLSADAVGGRQFKLTQEFFAQMLAVRRSGVTTAMGELEKKNLIVTSYGSIRINDREGLERIACECYGTITSRLDELLM